MPLVYEEDELVEMKRNLALFLINAQDAAAAARRAADLNHQAYTAALEYMQKEVPGHLGEPFQLCQAHSFLEGFRDKRQNKRQRVFGGTEADKAHELRYEHGWQYAGGVR